MDSNNNGQIDPKLKELYDKVMSTPTTGANSEQQASGPDTQTPSTAPTPDPLANSPISPAVNAMPSDQVQSPTNQTDQAQQSDDLMANSVDSNPMQESNDMSTQPQQAQANDNTQSQPYNFSTQNSAPESNFPSAIPNAPESNQIENDQQQQQSDQTSPSLEPMTPPTTQAPPAFPTEPVGPSFGSSESQPASQDWQTPTTTPTDLGNQIPAPESQTPEPITTPPSSQPNPVPLDVKGAAMPHHTPIWLELVIAVGLLMFLAIYTVVWMKVFGVPVPFLGK